MYINHRYIVQYPIDSGSEERLHDEV
jgi:hypothetical protein